MTAGTREVQIMSSVTCSSYTVTLTLFSCLHRFDWLDTAAESWPRLWIWLVLDSIIVGILLTPTQHFQHSDINNSITSSSSNNNNITNSCKIIMAGRGDSVTPQDTERDGGQKVNPSTTATGQTGATSLTGTSLTGRDIRVTAGDTGVTESEGSRGGTDTTVPAGNRLSTRSTDWPADGCSPVVKRSMWLVLVVSRGIQAAGQAVGQERWWWVGAVAGQERWWSVGAAAELATGATQSTKLKSSSSVSALRTTRAAVSTVTEAAVWRTRTRSSWWRSRYSGPLTQCTGPVTAESPELRVVTATRAMGVMAAPRSLRYIPNLAATRDDSMDRIIIIGNSNNSNINHSTASTLTIILRATQQLISTLNICSTCHIFLILTDFLCIPTNTWRHQDLSTHFRGRSRARHSTRHTVPLVNTMAPTTIWW